MVVEGINWDFKESWEIRLKDAEIYWEACGKGLLADE